MLDWGRSEFLNLIALPLLMIGTLATTAIVPYPRLRKRLLTAMLVVVIGDVMAVGWLIYRDYWPIVSARTPRPSPPIPPTPTPKPSPAPFQTSQLEFQASPEDTAATRRNYCLVADFNGSVTANERSIDITIDEANLDLCRYSNHGARLVSIRVGLSTSGIAKGRGIIWSPRTIVASRLNPGQTYNLSDPLRLSIRKVRWNKLSQSIVLVEVANRAGDSDHENRYRLISGNNTLTSN